jgi:hypothetical protein
MYLGACLARPLPRGTRRPKALAFGRGNGRGFGTDLGATGAGKRAKKTHFFSSFLKGLLARQKLLVIEQPRR